MPATSAAQLGWERATAVWQSNSIPGAADVPEGVSGS